MKVAANSIEEYIKNSPEHQREAIELIMNILSENLPEKFQATMSYGMPSYVIPLEVYPSGYHCKENEPLPFISVGAQKNHIGFYHMGIYAIREVLSWFEKEFPKHSDLKLDMGKSCIRFKNPDKIPFELLKELATKITAEQWIEVYEKAVKR